MTATKGPMASSTPAALRGEGLWFGYGTQWVLRDVSIQVDPGQVVGLWGPSGCGKSTLARVLTGRLAASKGTVSAPSPWGRARSAQLVLQHAEQSVNPRWKVREILVEGAPDVLPVIDSGLVLSDWLDAFPHELSGGELQRVNLARALLARPAYLVADEITASLDSINQVQIWELVRAGVHANAYGVLAISHDMPLLEQVCHRIVTMQSINS